ncbi:UPF0692 protein C19orf54 homolog [Varroa jacobsoni]|uniref:Actin maturation protease n=1 Tax=Varroa destructor TaxID=109461 RepID=A0A7M7KCM8_VARDE|nr:UPF0692 protein C19orf54 homolog [Varroa destructor]XP_022706110.1 UPF0692 protein C19orf54 homolog [Varroa jacobsoni]
MCDETAPGSSQMATSIVDVFPLSSDQTSRLNTFASLAETVENQVEEKRSFGEKSADAPVELVNCEWDHLSLYYPVAVMAYRNIEPILQRGNAQCGFVATAMAASAVGRRLDVQGMFTWAYNQSLTNIGDLFDIRNLKMLCDRYIGLPSHVMEFPTKEAMIADLFQGKVFLVPYDASYETGVPTTFNGYKAHWALLFGVLLMRQPCEPCMSGLDRLSVYKPIFRGNLEFYEAHMNSGAEYVLAQHGWFNEPDLWSVEELRESCCQLNEVDPKSAPEYVLPHGGIREGLRGKVLRLDL